MPDNTIDQVIVLTGATSGIGRETALRLARRNAHLVLAGRGRTALDQVHAEVERLGGTALTVPTDITDYHQVTALADTAAQHFGRIDTWINNAGVWAFGPVETQDIDTIRRVIDVDLLGAIHGIKAALPHLRHHGGTIITVTSAGARRALPLQAAYSAAKHGLAGFTEALRLELQHQHAPVRLVEILPSTTNTPLFTHAHRTPGADPQPLPPVYEPRVVANAIIDAIHRPVRQVYVGGAARLLDYAQRLSPTLLDRILLGPARVIQRQLDGQLPPATRDNLWQPADDTGHTTGSHGQRTKSVSLYTSLFGTHPTRATATAALLAAAGAALARRSRHQ